MKTRILDEAALGAITPAALRAYVTYEGWRKLEPFGQYSEVYAHADQRVRKEIILPFTTDIADYASSVSGVIQTLSGVENRDEIAIYNDLTRADRDVVRVRAPGADDDGSISIDPGVELVQHARGLLASAACAAREPRRAFHIGKIHSVEEYMRRVRLGQTEHGSFVVTLLAPVPPVLVDMQRDLWPELASEPFDRQVTRVLTQALRSVQGAIEASNRGDGLAAFTEAVSAGVSANLCEAIAAIVEQADGIDLSVTWARTRPAPVAADQIAFSRSDGEILREAARQFRLLEPLRDERLLGYVTVLRRPEAAPDGRIKIHALIDGRVKSVSTTLSPEDYAIASRANLTRQPISVTGDLERKGQRWTLVEPRDLQIIDDSPEDVADEL
jgi:hypothetical protein